MNSAAAQLCRLAGLHKVASSGGWLSVYQLDVELLSVWAQTLMQTCLWFAVLESFPKPFMPKKRTFVLSVFRMVCVSGMVSGSCMTQPVVSNLVAGGLYGNSVSHEASQDMELRVPER